MSTKSTTSIKASMVDTNITKTVGAGKDFTTLHEALVWVEGLRPIGVSTVILSLDDGTHILGGDGNYDSWAGAYYQIQNNMKLRIEPAVGDASSCILTLDGFDDGGEGPTIFYISGGDVTISGITFDPSLDGYPYPSEVTFCYGENGARIITEHCVIKSGYGILVEGLTSYSSSLDTFTTGTVKGVMASGGAKCFIFTTTFENVTDTALEVTNGASAMVYGGATFTSNAVDTNIPLNKLYNDGSFITDTTGPLTPESIVDSPITITVGIGKDYIELHDALKWVEKAVITKSGIITISLDDGVHTLGRDGELDPWYWSYYNISGGNNVFIKSASGVAANCTITHANFDDGGAFPTIFYVENSTVLFDKVTIDLALGGYLYSDQTTFLILDLAAVAFTQYCIASNVGTFAYAYSKSNISSIFDNLDATDNIYYLSMSATAHAKNSTLANTTEAIYVERDAKAFLQSVILSGNTSDSNVPLNVIQVDGSYVSDGTTSLVVDGERDVVAELTGVDISKAVGDILYKTMTADTTFTVSLTEGQSVTLNLNKNSFVVTWPTINWYGGEPIVSDTTYTLIVLWYMNGAVYGIGGETL